MMQKTTANRLGAADLGVGVGLRVPHYAHIIEKHPAMDFFEVISENFMVAGGKPLYHLDRVLEGYPVVQHGVSLGIGGPDDLDRDYLSLLKKLTRRVKPPWVSDHFCWGAAAGSHLHDLLPLPMNDEAVKRVVERARMVQDYLELPFLLENTSSYMTFNSSTLCEWEFVSEVAEEADIGLLFDVNNVYVSAYNHGFDPFEFIRSVPHERIVQIHLAGHTNLGKYIIDTHRGQVIDDVWDLYRETIRLTGPVSTLIEWDDEIPSFERLAAEAARAKQVRAEGVSLHLDPSAPPPPPLDMSLRQGERARPGWVQGGPREHPGDS